MTLSKDEQHVLHRLIDGGAKSEEELRGLHGIVDGTHGTDVDEGGAVSVNPKAESTAEHKAKA
jgi:hypothetical protein